MVIGAILLLGGGGCRSAVDYQQTEIPHFTAPDARKTLMQYIDPFGEHMRVIVTLGMTEAFLQTLSSYVRDVPTTYKFVGVKEFPSRKQVCFLWSYVSPGVFSDESEAVVAFEFPRTEPYHINEFQGKYLVETTFTNFLCDDDSVHVYSGRLDITSNGLDFPSGVGLSMDGAAKKSRFSIAVDSREEALKVIGLLKAAFGQYDTD